MSEQKFQVVVNGELADDSPLEQTKQRVATLFKTTADKISPMFSGQRVSIKKGLDQQTAEKYQAALKQAGLIAIIEPTAEPAQQPSSNLDNADIAPTGSTIDQTPTATDANIDTSGISMAEAGETIRQHEPITAPDIDVSSIAMAETGESLREHEAISEPDINISAISMAETGETIDQAVSASTPEIDISDLDMAEAGETIMEHPVVTEPVIDTSELNINENSLDNS